MGDRANIVIETEIIPPSQRLFLYTHWRGTEVPQIVQNALIPGSRWTDPSYLARIIFCKMLDGLWEGDTGFGINTHFMDNEHDVLLLRPLVTPDPHIELHRFNYDTWDALGNWAEPVRIWTFKEYCDLPSPTWESITPPGVK